MGFYGHALQAAFGGPGPLALLLQDVKCMAATAFFAVFGAIIAFMKVGPKQDRQWGPRNRCILSTLVRPSHVSWIRMCRM